MAKDYSNPCDHSSEPILTVPTEPQQPSELSSPIPTGFTRSHHQNEACTPVDGKAQLNGTTSRGALPPSGQESAEYITCLIRLAPKSYKKALQAMIREFRCYTAADLHQALSKKYTLARETSLLYARAIRWLSQHDARAQVACQQQRRKDLPRAQQRKHPRRRRPKSIPEKNFEALQLELTAQSRKGAILPTITSYWIRSTLIAGLRPCEFQNAKWCEMNPRVLMVETAKQQCGKRPKADDAAPPPAAHREPEIRAIPISDETDRATVDMCLKLIRSWIQCWPIIASQRRRGRPARSPAYHFSDAPDVKLTPQQIQEAFEALYNSVRNVLRMACRKLWAGKKFYSLYTLRSQFSANTQVVYGREATARMMGHDSPASPAARRYASSRWAHSKYKQIAKSRLVPEQEKLSTISPLPRPQSDGTEVSAEQVPENCLDLIQDDEEAATESCRPRG